MSEASQTSSSLLERVRDPADEDAWREFRALYEPLLVSYLGSQGLAPQDIPDVVQLIFVKLLRELPRFELDRGRARFRTWLWQVTRTTAVDWARQQRRWSKAEEAQRQRLFALSAANGEEPEPAWCDAHHRRVLDFVLESVQAQSQPATWACFDRHVLHGQPGPEVGASLGLTAGAVRKNASMVLARVRRQCADYLEDLGDG